MYSDTKSLSPPVHDKHQNHKPESRFISPRIYFRADKEVNEIIRAEKGNKSEYIRQGIKFYYKYSLEQEMFSSKGFNEIEAWVLKALDRVYTVLDKVTSESDTIHEVFLPHLEKANMFLDQVLTYCKEKKEGQNAKSQSTTNQKGNKNRQKMVYRYNLYADEEVVRILNQVKGNRSEFIRQAIKAYHQSTQLKSSRSSKRESKVWKWIQQTRLELEELDKMTDGMPSESDPLAKCIESTLDIFDQIPKFLQK